MPMTESSRAASGISRGRARYQRRGAPRQAHRRVGVVGGEVSPRAAASWMRALVRSGHFTCTKCTSVASVRPEAAMARRTAAAVARTCAMRPISSGRKIVRKGGGRPRAPCPRPLALCSLPPRPVPPRRATISRWGESPPSVPPTSPGRPGADRAGDTPRRAARAPSSAITASGRVKSLTQPLPSVLPNTATISCGATARESIRRLQPRDVGGVAGRHAEDEAFGHRGSSGCFFVVRGAGRSATRAVGGGSCKCAANLPDDAAPPQAWP